MIVWLVWSGEYDGRDVEAVYLSKEAAVRGLLEDGLPVGREKRVRPNDDKVVEYRMEPRENASLGSLSEDEMWHYHGEVQEMEVFE